MYVDAVDRRERLIDAMCELMWERGYVGTSPQAILTRAGVGQGSMYHHFSGKADLAGAALRRNAEIMLGDGEQVFDAEGTVVQRLTAYLRRPRAALKGCRIGRMTEDPDVIIDSTLRKPVAEVLAWYQDRVAEILREGQATGELRDDFDPRQVGATLIAVVQGGYVLAKAAQSPGPFDNAVEGAVVLLSALRKNAVSS